MISLIAAVNDNGVIGKEGHIPWKIPTDMVRFKKITINHPVIMGRMTWQSIPGMFLKERVNIVVTSDVEGYEQSALQNIKMSIKADWPLHFVSNVEEATKIAEKEIAEKHLDDEILIIGGTSIYQQFVPNMDRLYLTRVFDCTLGDAYLPILPDELELEQAEFYTTDPPHSFCIYGRH